MRGFAQRPLLIGARADVGDDAGLCGEPSPVEPDQYRAEIAVVIAECDERNIRPAVAIEVGGGAAAAIRVQIEDAGPFFIDHVAAGDFNADGNPDLLSTGYPPDVLLGGGDGRLHSYEVDEEGAGVLDLDADSRSGAAPDFNGDGRP